MRIRDLPLAQAAAVDAYAPENAALKREPAKLQAKLDQLFETYEWQVRVGEGGDSFLFCYAHSKGSTVRFDACSRIELINL